MAHHALSGDGKENEEPNPDELADPMTDDEFPTEDDEETLTPVGTDDEEDPFDTEIGGDEDELPSDDEEEINSEEPIDFEDGEDLEAEPESDIINEPVKEPISVEGVGVPEGYKIANIKFDENLKTGELFRTGNITVMVDMVDGSGKVYTESNNYHFYIDEETHLPVIDAADVPVALYNALVSSIQADAQFIKADTEGKGGETVKSEPAADEIYYNADDVNAASDELQKDDEDGYFDFTDDGEGDISFSAKEPVDDTSDGDDFEDVVPDNAAQAKPIKASDLFSGVEDEPDDEEDGSDEVITPTYKVDDTVIDKPADNIDFEDGDDEDLFTSEDDEDPFADEDDDSFDSDEKDFPDFDDVKVEKDDDDDEDVDESEELVEEMQTPAAPQGAPQQNQQKQQPQQGQAQQGQVNAQPQQGQNA